MGPIIAGVAAIVGAGAAVIGTINSAKAANRAAAAQRKLQQLRTNQVRRQQVREARIKRGRVANIAALTGTQGSSAELGAKGSIQSQLATNLSFLDQALGITQQISSQQAKAQTFSAIAGLGRTLFNVSGGPKQVAKLLS